MNPVRPAIFAVVCCCAVSNVRAGDDLPPAAKEVAGQFEKEVIAIDRKTELEIAEWRGKTAIELKKSQDAFCKEAKLDEAVAVRDLIRSLERGTFGAFHNDLPAAAKEVCKPLESALIEIQTKAAAQVDEARDRAKSELKKIQDAFCKEAKLDEAVAVRDLIRMLRDGVTNALPDPGYVKNGANDIGKAFYFSVTGVTSGGSIYGTDIYTNDSHLAMAAVHSGVLRAGQQGVVKVTILPGQSQYTATLRNGVTSYAYGNWSVSFKVERAYGIKPKAPILGSSARK